MTAPENVNEHYRIDHKISDIMHFEHAIASYISVITWGSCTHSALMQVQQCTHQSNILCFNNNITPEGNNTIFF